MLHRRRPAATSAPPLASKAAPASATGSTSCPPVAGSVELSAAATGDVDGDDDGDVDGDDGGGSTERKSSVACSRLTRFAPPNDVGVRPPACAARINHERAAGWSTP